MDQMRAYINKDPGRVLAFNNYRTRYKLQGKVTTYEYYFDFLRQGGVDHPVLVDTRMPVPPIVVFAGDLTKKLGKRECGRATRVALA